MQKHNFIFLFLIAAGFIYSNIADAAIYYLPHPEKDSFNARKNDALGRNVVCRSDYKYKCTGTGYSGGSGASCKGKYASCKCDTGYKWSGGVCSQKTCSDFGYLGSEDTTKSCTKIIGSGSTSVSDKLVPGYIDSISKVTSGALSSSLSGSGFTNTIIGGNANIADSSLAGASNRVMMNTSMPSGLTCYKCTECNTTTYKYSCSGTGYAASQSGATCNSLYTKCACDTGYIWSNGKCEKIICNAGFYLDGNTCTECDAGRYSASGATICYLCNNGTYADKTGSTSCTSCPAGWTPIERARLGATSLEQACTKCAAGTYKSGVGSGKCIDCPVAKPNSEAGSTSIDDCYSTCTAKSCSGLGACNGLKCTGFSSTEITSAAEIGEGVEIGGFETCKATNCLSSQTYYQNGFVVTTCKTDKDGWTLNSTNTNCNCAYNADDTVYKYTSDDCSKPHASCSNLGCNDKYKTLTCSAGYIWDNGSCEKSCTPVDCRGIKSCGNNHECTMFGSVSEGVETYDTCEARNCNNEGYQNGYRATSCKTDKEGWSLVGGMCFCTADANGYQYTAADCKKPNASCSNLGCNDKYKTLTCSVGTWNGSACEEVQCSDCEGYIQLADDNTLKPFTGSYALSGNITIDKPKEAFCSIGQTMEYCTDCSGHKYYRCVGEVTITCGTGTEWCETSQKCVATCSGYTQGTGTCSGGQTLYSCTSCDGTKYHKCLGSSSGDSGNTGGGGSSGGSGGHPCNSYSACSDFCKCMKNANMLQEGTLVFQTAIGGEGVQDARGDCTCSFDGNAM